MLQIRYRDLSKVRHFFLRNNYRVKMTYIGRPTLEIKVPPTNMPPKLAPSLNILSLKISSRLAD